MRYLVLILILVASCAPAEEESSRAEPAEDEACTVVQTSTPIEADLEESSGVVASRRHSGVLWTHNDSGWPAEIFAISPEGELLGQIAVTGAENVDWEDIALAPCEGGDCLFIADIGDNRAGRETVAVYRVAEPDPRASETARAERFPMRYPDVARDAEGLFVMPDGELFVVSKGIRRRAALFRYPPPLRAGEMVELEHVTDLSAGPLDLLDQITGADVSPSGRWIAIRTYQELRVHRPQALLQGDTVPALRYSLIDVEGVQGEGVSLLDDGTVYLTSEAGFDDAPGTVARLQCRLP